MTNSHFADFKLAPIVFLLVQSTIVFAAPGSPGVPQPPVEVFKEDFENVAGQTTPLPGQALSVSNYISASKDVNGNPVRYTAEGTANQTATPASVPFWLNESYCNGMWVGYSEIFPTGLLPSPYPANTGYCGSTVKGPDNWSYLRALANVLGNFTGTTAPNHVIAAYTEMGGNPANAATNPLVQLKLVAPVSLPAGGRFVTFSVAMGATNCRRDTNNTNSVDPQISFYQVLDPAQSSLNLTGSNVVKLNSSPKNPCDSDNVTDEVRPGATIGPQNTAKIRVAQLDGDLPVMVSGNTVAMQLVNEKAAGYGNDAAFDNLLIMDMTPQLDKSFEPLAITSTTTTVLTFTITNTTDLYAKSGWNFTDRLPAGLEFAGAPSTTCNAQTSMTVSGDTLTVANGKIDATVPYCTVTVPVKLAAGTVVPAGGLTFVNQPAPAAPGAGEVTTGFISPPTSAELTVTPVADMAAVSTPPENFAIGTPGSITTQCVNNGPDVAVAATCVVDPSTLPSGAQTVCTPASGSANLLPGQTISCVTSFTMNTAGTVNLSTTAGSTSTDPNPGNEIQPAKVTAVSPATDMQAIAPTDVAANVGTSTTVKTSCTNNGPDAAANASCTVSGAPSGATTTCTPSSPQASLAVGQSISCETTFTPTTANPFTLTTTIGTTTNEVNTQNNVAETKVTLGNYADVEAIAPTDQTTNVGTSTTVKTSCTNNGPVAAADATCTVTGAPSDAKIVCTPSSPQASLAVGQSMSCEITFTPKTNDPITLTTTSGTSTPEVNTQNNSAVTNVKVGTPDGAASVPTLGEWALMLLSTALAGFAAVFLRRTRSRIDG